MSLLRNDDDNTINFQRASCTLDGCVKIWTSRVDSVGTETGKLLSNLESDGRIEDDDEENSDNPDADPTQVKKKKVNRGSATTLAKDPSQLKNKKPDLEFAVDPLFRKTCADFDEGGASGLLMNHLSLGIGSEGCMRVIFDASDSMGKVEEEDVIEEPEDDVDLSFLRSKLFNYLNQYDRQLTRIFFSEEYLPDITVLEDKAISHSLSEFSFSKDTFVFDDATFQDDTRFDDDADENGGFELNLDAGDDAPEDFFVGADAVGDDYEGGMGGGDYGGDNNSNGSIGPVDDVGGRPGPYVAFDPRRAQNGRDLILALAETDGNSLEYFDQTFLKNWAGPEHWKLTKKTIRRSKPSEIIITQISKFVYFDAADGEAAVTKTTKTRSKKEAVRIDFLTPCDKSIKELTEELFAPATKGAGINLQGTTAGNKKGKKTKEKRDDHRLPDDIHFSSRQLVTLFLKPKFVVCVFLIL